MLLKKFKILLLEDLAFDAELISREIKNASISCEIKRVDSKEEYIKALKEVPPDIILSDHSLPFFSSLQALKLAIEICGKIPFILVTGTMSEEFAVELMKEGAWDYVPKSHLQRLPGAIIKAMEKYKQDRIRQKLLYDAILNEAYLQEGERIANYGSWELDVINRKLRLSKEAYSILGYLEGDSAALYENILGTAHAEEALHIQEVVRRILKHQDLEEFKDSFRLVDKDGAYRIIKVEFALKYSSLGKLIRINGFIQNVTELVSIEDKLLESQEQFRSLAENISETAIFVLDAGAHILNANSEASRIFGYTADEMKSKHMSAICGTREFRNHELLEYLESSPKSGRLETTCYLQKKDGVNIWGDVRVVALGNKAGLSRGFILMFYELALSSSRYRMVSPTGAIEQ